MRKHKEESQQESQKKKEGEEISKAIQLALLEDLTKKVEMMSLQLPVNVVKSTSKTSTLGYIYLIQEREFLDKNEDIYKVGMTCQPGQKRFGSYPKGSKLLYQVACDDCVKVEKLIIEVFKERFLQMRDIGLEYFHGDYLEMFDIICEVIKRQRETEKEEISDENELPVDDSFTSVEKAKKYDQIRSIFLSNFI
jgi:hypothetical protein